MVTDPKIASHQGCFLIRLIEAIQISKNNCLCIQGKECSVKRIQFVRRQRNGKCIVLDEVGYLFVDCSSLATDISEASVEISWDESGVPHDVLNFDLSNGQIPSENGEAVKNRLHQ